MITPEMSSFKLGEVGVGGIRIFQGISNTELKKELNFPHSVSTYNNMSYHSSISAALQLFCGIVTTSKFKFIAPEKATKQEEKRTMLMNKMMHSMEHTWVDFLKDVLSSQQYGFSVHEKVFKKENGLISWKKIPIRAQESIVRFIYSDDGREIIGVEQDLTKDVNAARFANIRKTSVAIPADKYLHFRVGRHRGDPFGKSPLRDAYLSWKYLTLLEELEAIGVNKDLVGVPCLYLPADYLASDASEERKKIRSYLENSLRNLHLNKQSAVVLPSIVDPDSKQQLVKLDLLSIDGKKGYDIDKIKKYYQNQIYTDMMADLLILGQGSGGSFSLAEFKSTITYTYAQSLMNMICDNINRDLVKQTYQLNGWDESRACTLVTEEISQASLDEISKLIQRTASVGLIEVDRPVLNMVRKHLGVREYPEDAPVNKENLTMQESKSGEGMKTPFEGTRTSGSGSNDNDNNLSNAS